MVAVGTLQIHHNAHMMDLQRSTVAVELNCSKNCAEAALLSGQENTDNILSMSLVSLLVGQLLLTTYVKMFFFNRIC